MSEVTPSQERVSCPNCGGERPLKFCPSCGQNNRDFQRALRPVVSDLLREALELDGRLVQSLKLLLFKPGQLSLEFSSNRRASFISPVRLYLFCSILFFFVLSMTTDVYQTIPDPAVTQSTESVGAQQDEIAEFIEFLNPEQRAKAEELAARTGSIAQGMLAGLARAYADTMAADPEPVGRVARFLFHRAVDGINAPRRFAVELMDNVPIAFFFLVPFCALLLKLLYIGSRRYYVEHLVYSLHLFSMSFLVYTALILLPDTDASPPVTVHVVPSIPSEIAAEPKGTDLSVDVDGPTTIEIGNADAQTTPDDDAGGWLVLVLFVFFFWYYYRSLRRFYGQGRWRTLFKFVVLNGLFLIVLAPALVVVMAVTVSLL